MTTIPKASTLAAVLLLTGVSGPVLAADMPEYPPIIEAPEPLPLAAVGGWYLRGDIGYKIYNTPDAKLSNPDFADGSYTDGRGSLYDAEMGDSFNIGIGAGYKFNDYLRADVTLDYETPGEYKGKLFCPTADCQDPNGSNGDNGEAFTHEKADITAWSALGNVYADLGTWYGLTPYVGAGLGVSYLQTKNVRSSTGANYSDGDKTNFAWALMAGASYAVTDQLSVDLGYRYLNLGDAQSGDISDGIGGTTRIDYENIDAHEVRLGLRYNLY